MKAIDLFEISLTATPMNGDTRVVSWKSAATDTSTRSEGSRTATTDDEFRALKATWDKVQRDRELAQMLEEIEAKAEREEAKARPVKIKTFSIE